MTYRTMYASSQMNQKNVHLPAKRILDRDQGYVIGVVDMCLCADHACGHIDFFTKSLVCIAARKK